MKNLIIIGVCAVLILAVVGLPVAVYTSQSSLPGESLYSFKLSIESFRLQLTQDSANQMELNFEFANRRYDEIFKLANSKQVPPASVISQFQNTLDQCFYLAATGTEANQKVSLERLRELLQGQLLGLQQLQSQTDSQISEVLAKVLVTINSGLQLAEIGLTDPLTFRQQFSSQVDTPTSDQGVNSDKQVTETPTPGEDQALTETAVIENVTLEAAVSLIPPDDYDNPPDFEQTPSPEISENPTGSETPSADDNDLPPGFGQVITATPIVGGTPGIDSDLPPDFDLVITTTPEGSPGVDGDNPPGT